MGAAGRGGGAATGGAGVEEDRAVGALAFLAAFGFGTDGRTDQVMGLDSDVRADREAGDGAVERRRDGAGNHRVADAAGARGALGGRQELVGAARRKLGGDEGVGRREARADAVRGEPVEHARARLRGRAVAGDEALDRRVVAVARVARIGNAADEAVEATWVLQFEQGRDLWRGEPGVGVLGGGAGGARSDEGEQHGKDYEERQFFHGKEVRGGGRGRAARGRGGTGGGAGGGREREGLPPFHRHAGKRLECAPHRTACLRPRRLSRRRGSRRRGRRASARARWRSG